MPDSPATSRDPSRRGGAAKRAMDVVVSGSGLLALAPFLALVAVAIWLEDRRGPFYVGRRAGRGRRPFGMVKFRSMTARADRTGVDSTAADDPRITRVGKVIRRLKLDEFAQLWNVLIGQMSLVGPRPQVERDVALYTGEELGLLAVRPGITDFASIVFADEGELLEGAQDPDLRYHQTIRPWKSRLGLHYVANRSLGLDASLVAATLLGALSRRAALRWVARMLRASGADETLVEVATRALPPQEAPPPGAVEVVRSR